MSFFQRIVLSLMPASWAKSAEAESRTWVFECRKCGHEQSIWDAGGIRWKASGTSWSLRRCTGCGKTSWQKVSYNGS